MSTPKRLRPTITRPLTPVLTWTARRNARIREQAALMRLTCCACRAPLAAHVGAGNRWVGCRAAQPVSSATQKRTPYVTHNR